MGFPTDRLDTARRELQRPEAKLSLSRDIAVATAAVRVVRVERRERSSKLFRPRVTPFSPIFLTLHAGGKTQHNRTGRNL